MKNRRSHARVTIKSIAEVHCLNDDRRFKAFVGGISRGGLEFYAPEKVETDAPLKIKLSFLDSGGRAREETLSGRVRWSAPFQEAFIAGVQFDTVIEKKKFPALDEYIRNAERYFL